MVFRFMPPSTNPKIAQKNLETFCERVVELRKSTGMMPVDFARKCKISSKHYWNIEKGKSLPSLRGYIAICLAGGVKEIPLIGRRD